MKQLLSSCNNLGARRDLKSISVCSTSCYRGGRGNPMRLDGWLNVIRKWNHTTLTLVDTHSLQSAGADVIERLNREWEALCQAFYVPHKIFTIQWWGRSDYQPGFFKWGNSQSQEAKAQCCYTASQGQSPAILLNPFPPQFMPFPNPKPVYVKLLLSCSPSWPHSYHTGRILLFHSLAFLWVPGTPFSLLPTQLLAPWRLLFPVFLTFFWT